jgi:DNA gyrase subunit A
MLALDLGMPKLMNIKEIITAFVKFRKEVINRRTLFLLKEARAKSHLLLGLRVAIDNIDEVIAIIRNSSDSAEARVKLLDKLWQVDDAIRQLIELIDEAHLSFSGPFKFTEAQVKAILEMRLQRLTGMEKEKIEQELNKLSGEIAYYLSILNSEPELLALLKKELIAAKEEFATKRLTEIETIELNGYEIEDLINREDMVVTVTLTGYIKRVALSHYRAQNRGGKGRMALSMDDADATTQVFVGSTHTPILFFSSLGQVYYLKLYKLPLGSPQAKGKALVNLLPLKKGETITNIMALPENTEEWKDLYILFATAQGGIRRNSLADFSYIPSNGKIAIKLQDDDTLIGVRLAKEENHIFLATSQGKAIRFAVEKLRVFKSRSSDGVISMRLANGDHIVGITILEGIETTQEYRESYLEIPLEKRRQIAGGELKNLQLNLVDNSDNKLVFEDIEKLAKAEQFILSVTENGFGKCTSAYQYRVTNRGGSGITNLAISKKTGNVVSVLPVTTTDELILVTNTGKMIRCKLDNVRITGRNTSGVILFKTAKDEHVVSASLVAQEDEIVEADIQSV